MPYTKTFMKSRPACKVKFTVPADLADASSSVFLVGEFNNWDPCAHPMKKLKNGSFSLEMELALGKDYQYRYLGDNEKWFNDSDCDAYVPCSFSGGENSVIKV